MGPCGICFFFYKVSLVHHSEHNTGTSSSLYRYFQLCLVTRGFFIYNKPVAIHWHVACSNYSSIERIVRSIYHCNYFRKSVMWRYQMYHDDIFVFWLVFLLFFKFTNGKVKVSFIVVFKVLRITQTTLHFYLANVFSRTPSRLLWQAPHPKTLTVICFLQWFWRRDETGVIPGYPVEFNRFWYGFPDTFNKVDAVYERTVDGKIVFFSGQSQFCFYSVTFKLPLHFKHNLVRTWMV